MFLPPTPQAQAAALIPTVGAVLADLGHTVERLKTLADDAERDGGLGMRAVTLRELRAGLTDTAKLLAVLRPPDAPPPELRRPRRAGALIASAGVGEKARNPGPARCHEPAPCLRQGGRASRGRSTGWASPRSKLLLDALCKVDAVAWARARLGVVPDDWQKQLMRSTSDLAALCGRRVGKSQSAGWVAAHHVVEGEGRTALCISPTQRQSGELFRLAKAAIVKAMPDASFPTDNRLSIELPNGSRLLSLPGDPGTVRGLTASLVLLDETQSLPDGGHELFASVRPMLATTGGRMIVLGRRGMSRSSLARQKTTTTLPTRWR